MINYSQIRDNIIIPLKNYLSFPVVLFKQNSPKPNYPFASYNVTSLYIPTDAIHDETFKDVPSSNPDFTSDIEATRTEQASFTISFTFYSLTPNVAEQKALDALAWFKFLGYEELKKNDIIVKETSSIQDRDTLIIDDYESRRGFDVIFRYVSHLNKIIDNVESVKIL